MGLFDQRGKGAVCLVARLTYEQYCDAVEATDAIFVELMAGSDLETPVPTCPGWTLADLIKHHGTTHRWMEHLVSHRATERVWSRDVPVDLPQDTAAYPAWLARSAEMSLRTLRGADPDAPNWTHGADRHVRFFPRRLLCEAVVHLADAELALGRTPRVAPGIAADGIDEFLENLPYYSWIAEPVSRLDRDGETLRFSSTDTDDGWLIKLGDGCAWQTDRGAAQATVTVRGACGDLLLLTYGRLRPSDAGRFIVTGDVELLSSWLGATGL
ncbi:maleylpyruvate isomerase family mycothiol-dependent enzyme [Nonomuraea sediminis]|uniref:maleylpyruvate isomerase family mycothiol-dependent enzyme n=1 Tax=Nonomuraea sediminis TaxID=2835864 RepID=UPI001BDD8AD4|nr:maleylpyruvate isomerase family mycothiol-dependent enzyme [Nonomuraea sediminis]